MYTNYTNYYGSAADDVMNDDTGGNNNDYTFPNGFPALIIIFAVVGHLGVIAIVLYLGCCKNGCKCKCSFENNTNSASSNVHDTNAIDQSDATNLVGPPEYTRERSPIARLTSSRRLRPVAPGLHNTTLLARVRARIHNRNNSRSANREDADDTTQPGIDVEIQFGVQPPPYSEYSSDTSVGGHVNAGADLPTYDDYVRRVPSYSYSQETGCLEIEQPPKYEDVVQT